MHSLTRDGWQRQLRGPFRLIDQAFSMALTLRICLFV